MITQSYKKIIAISLSIIFILTLLIIPILREKSQSTNDNLKFDSLRAYSNLEYQTSLGPRTIGSEAHQITIEWIISEMESMGWSTEIQEGLWHGKKIKNVVAKKFLGTPWIILGAHYDSRFVADRDVDPNLRDQPVLGANDGASGVAVLLELARVLPSQLDKEIWMVFFDAEDNGNYDDWEWAIGSTIFVDTLKAKPDAVVIVSMVGDADLNIYKEKNSDVDLNDEIWGHADKLGYNQFIPEYKYQIIDDHIPFLQAGIPAIDIIDIDYPYWHTTRDTPDNVSHTSLEAVGETIFNWILSK
jgi:hypothetical protein